MAVGSDRQGRDTRDAYAAALLFERFAICKHCKGDGATADTKMCMACCGLGVVKRKGPRRIGRVGWERFREVERLLRRVQAEGDPPK
jgi:DnaJ-class molecular chaperone